MSPSTRVIYDIGAHRGDDVGYYLLKADKVVAVEANPDLADIIRARFPAELNAGTLIVENFAVVGRKHQGQISFFLNQDFDFLSTVVVPQANPESFKEITVQSVSFLELVKKHGSPHFVKLDVEGGDAEILEAMLSSKIHPPFLSVENHDPSIFGLMAGLGGYSRFKFQRGSEVARDYGEATCIDAQGESFIFRFKRHSAGPFGDDLEGPWYSKESFSVALSALGTGWIDIHASFGEPDSLEVPPFSLPAALWRLARIRLQQLHPEAISILALWHQRAGKIRKRANRLRRKIDLVAKNLGNSFHRKKQEK